MGDVSEEGKIALTQLGVVGFWLVSNGKSRWHSGGLMMVGCGLWVVGIILR